MALEPAMTAFTSREALAMRISALIATELDRGARLNGSAAIAVSGGRRRNRFTRRWPSGTYPGGALRLR